MANSWYFLSEPESAHSSLRNLATTGIGKRQAKRRCLPLLSRPTQQPAKLASSEAWTMRRGSSCGQAWQTDLSRRDTKGYPSPLSTRNATSPSINYITQTTKTSQKTRNRCSGSGREELLLRELENKGLAGLALHLLNARELLVCAAGGTVGGDEGRVGHQEAAAAQHVLRVALLAVDFDGPDVFSVAQWAEVTLDQPQRDAGRVVEMAAVEFCVGAVLEADAAGGLSSSRPLLAFPAPLELSAVHRQVLLLACPLDLQPLFCLLRHPGATQGTQELEHDDAEAGDDGHRDYSQNCEDDDAGEADGLRCVQAVSADGEGGLRGRVLWSLPGAAFGQARRPVGIGSDSGGVAGQEGKGMLRGIEDEDAVGLGDGDAVWPGSSDRQQEQQRQDASCDHGS